MSKVTLALGSFIVGACSALIIASWSHTSTTTQPSFAFADEPSPSTATPISMPGFIPSIPGLGPTLVKGFIKEGTQQLDGFNCTDCSLNNVHLIYGGGAYKLSNVAISGPLRLQLTGAALNTWRLLMLLQVKIPEPPQVIPWLENPNPKIEINVPAKTIGKTIQMISLPELPKSKP